MATPVNKTETNSIEAEKAKVAERRELIAKANAEADSFASRLASLLQEGSNLGAIALQSLAENLGRGTNKSGRPSESAYLAFVAATAHRKMSYEQRADLCRKANSQVPEGHKPVAVLTAKANHQTGAARYRINMPVAVDISVGNE